MISERMVDYVKGSSVIRAMFEEGKKLANQYGAENVYDFSLGNPNVAAPAAVNEAIKEVLDTEESTFVHGYMNNSGYEDVRQIIADSINRRFETHFNQSNIVMTVGAAGGLNVILKTLLDPGDEVIAFAPYFGEYRSYTANYDGKLVVVSADTENFQLNLQELDKNLAAVLNKKQEELGTDIYLISDEPYRELVYDGAEVVYLTKYYDNTIVGYSYSKSLSLPGERIGYLVLPDELSDAENIKSAANVATRILGYVNAPSLMQRVIAKCVDVEVNVEPYNKNRELLYKSLMEYGYECIKPEGAFYMFVKTPGDEKEFVNAAKSKNILVVPGSSFACPGYVRIAYCVSYDTVKGSLNGFKELAKEFGILK